MIKQIWTFLQWVYEKVELHLTYFEFINDILRKPFHTYIQQKAKLICISMPYA